MTGSLIYGVIAGGNLPCGAIVKNGRLDGKTVQNIVGLEGISIPQGYGSSSVPLFVLLMLSMKNPFHEGTQYRYSGDPETLRHGRRSGDYRRSARSDFGLAAGEGFKGCASLMITVAAIMVLFPPRQSPDC